MNEIGSIITLDNGDQVRVKKVDKSQNLCIGCYFKGLFICDKIKYYNSDLYCSPEFREDKENVIFEKYC